MLRNIRNIRNICKFRGVINSAPPSKGVTFRYSPGKGCRDSRRFLWQYPKSGIMSTVSVKWQPDQ